jgi:hypothetical protein
LPEPASLYARRRNSIVDAIAHPNNRQGLRVAVGYAVRPTYSEEGGKIMGSSAHHRCVLVVALVGVVWSGPSWAAAPRVDLEVALDDTALTTQARTWSDLLAQAGFSSVRIRSANNDSPSLQMTGTPSSPAYRVVGVLNDQNQLVLPKGRFGLSDRGKIEQWLQKLREGGEEALSVKPVAFGLLPKQLVAVHEALKVPVQFATLGKPPREAAKKIADGLTLKFISDETAQRALATPDPVADELQGLTSGTALAAILRPLGLVMFPEKNAGEIRLRIADTRGAKEHWPIGWPPKGNPSETLPELFKYLPVEIENTPLLESLMAIGGRLKTPVLFDHNALARDNVDLNIKVSFPRTNTFYARAFDRLLFQARLKYDIRLDEADKPFLWVTTLKQ